MSDEKAAEDIFPTLLRVPFNPPDPALLEFVEAADRALRGVTTSAYLADPDEWYLPDRAAIEGLQYVRRWWQNDQLFEELIPADQIIQDDPPTSEAAETPYAAWDEWSSLNDKEAPDTPFMAEYRHVGFSPALGAPFDVPPRSFFGPFNDMYGELWRRAINVNEMSMKSASPEGIVEKNYTIDPIVQKNLTLEGTASSNPKAAFTKDDPYEDDPRPFIDDQPAYAEWHARNFTDDPEDM